LEEKIEEYKEIRNMDCVKLSKRKNKSTISLDNLVENKEEQAGEALKARFVWDLGF
jgi:hypothetical protein